MSIDHVAVAPLYALAAAAVLVLLADLFITRRQLIVAVGAIGLAVAGCLALADTRARGSFCVGEDCSYATSDATRWLIAATCVVALLLLVCSPNVVGEYVFLLLCSVLGVAALVGAQDVLTLVVGVETLTLPTYALVSLGVGRRAASGAFTMFLISVLSAGVSLFGAALLYATTGVLHFARFGEAFAELDPQLRPMTAVGSALLVGGLLFKVAAVPFHSWVPAAYDGAPRAVAGYLATVAKLGGVAAVVMVVLALSQFVAVIAPVLAAVAVVTMTVGNLLALRQHRVVRLLAWSSVAQLGYVLAPLGVLATTEAPKRTLAGVFGYLGPYLLVTLGIFAVVIAMKAKTLEELRGRAFSQPTMAMVLVLGLFGLAGLPPGFAGLWAKFATVRAVLTGSGWPMWMLLAAIGVNVVLGLAVYLRVVRVLFDRVADPITTPAPGVAAIACAVAAVTLLLGLYPQPFFAVAQQVSAAMLA